jgi:hypothetical protein
VAITWASVVAIAPELSTIAVDSQTAILADVDLEVRAANWPSTAHADRAKKYLAAHVASLSRRGGSGGAIQSQTVGSVSVTYAVPVSATVLGSTAYGQEYQRLKRLYFGGPRVA